MGAITITTTLHPRGPAAAVLLSDEQSQAIGEGAKSPAVQVTVNGCTFPGRVARRGGETLVGFSKANRLACRVEPGQEIEVTIALDTAERTVEVPPALSAALAADGDAQRIYAGLAFTHRKEFARWVAEAKRDETRRRRVAETLRMLREGRTRS